MVSQKHVANDTKGIVVTDGYAYIAAGDEGLVIVDVKNPSSLVKTGQCLLPGYAEDVAVSDLYAYVAAGVAGIRVVDISDMYHPQEAGSYDTRDYAKDVTIDGQYIYVADGVDGLVILQFLNSGSSANKRPDTKIETAEVDAAKGIAKFTWTGSDDTTPTKDLLYCYRLVRPGPSYDEWSSWSKDTTKTYSGLTSGDYKFQVRAKDGDGAIDPSPVSRDFRINTAVSISPPTREYTSIATAALTQESPPIPTDGFGWKKNSAYWKKDWNSRVEVSIFSQPAGTDQINVFVEITGKEGSPVDSPYSLEIPQGFIKISYPEDGVELLGVECYLLQRQVYTQEAEQPLFPIAMASYDVVAMDESALLKLLQPDTPEEDRQILERAAKIGLKALPKLNRSLGFLKPVGVVFSGMDVLEDINKLVPKTPFQSVKNWLFSPGFPKEDLNERDENRYDETSVVWPFPSTNKRYYGLV